MLDALYFSLYFAPGITGCNGDVMLESVRVKVNG